MADELKPCRMSAEVKNCLTCRLRGKWDGTTAECNWRYPDLPSCLDPMKLPNLHELRRESKIVGIVNRDGYLIQITACPAHQPKGGEG